MLEKDGSYRACDHKHQFSCVQYNLPTKIAKSVVEWGKKNIPDELLYQPPGDDTYGRETNVHCTVFFGLHTDSATPVIYLLENEHTFPIKLGQVSCFHNENFDVVKIEAYSDELCRMHNKLADCLKC